MKYIRTRNGLYTDDNVHTIVNQKKPFRFDDGDYSEIGDKFIIVNNRYYKVLKQADTIEELCDEFVIIPISVNCNPFVRNINDNINHFINDSHIIYGAIWVKGEHNEPILKPVAEMNEKGELELL